MKPMFAHLPAVEVLENRQLASATHHVVRIAALGDSYSDEYRFYPPDRSSGQGWVEQLAHHNRANFGKFSRRSRGEPRDQGYANNWALSGATSADLPGQTAGVAAQAAAGQIDYATILMGGNDFLNELVSVVTDPTAAATATTDIGTIAQNIITRVEDSVGTILAASPGVKVVVATLPPVSDLPLVKAADTTADTSAIVQATDAAQAQVNSALTAFAAGNSRIAIADFAGAATATLANPDFTLGKVKIDSTLPSDNPHHFFLADGVHPGTVAQGLLANTFINAIDNSFGEKIKPLTNHQILGDARLARQ